MKRIITFLFAAFYFVMLFANQVDEQTAMKVAQLFNRGNAANKVKSNRPTATLYKCIAKQKSTAAPAATAYYVFSNGDKGFTIVSGNDAAMPILGHSDTNNFDPANIPPAAAAWLDNYKKQIEYLAENNIPADSTVKAAWSKILGAQTTPATANAAFPLIKTTWDQGIYYHDLCPSLKGWFSSRRDTALTGCVATAMAQIMRYWKYPTHGQGIKTYLDSLTMTQLSVNFNNATYNWDNMPEGKVNSKNLDVATLMYHCGVAVEMKYGFKGSSAWTLAGPISAESAFRTYFGYDASLIGLGRADYSDTEWISKLKAELDAERPMQYRGSDPKEGSHSFICDGYNSNNEFHFNWGWSGEADGYFAINSLNPNIINSSNPKSYSFSNDQAAIFGIKPSLSNGSLNIKFNSLSVTNPTPLYSQSNSFTASIKNSGTATFNGNICAAIFDQDGLLVDSVAVQVVSLGGNETQYKQLTFTSSTPLSIFPGAYKVYLMYRSLTLENAQWTLIRPEVTGVKDYIDLTVGVSRSQIELGDNMVINHNKPIYGKGLFSATMTALNNTAVDVSDFMYLDLYNSGGKFVASVGSNYITIKAHANATLSFYTNNLNVPAGIYYLTLTQGFGLNTLTSSTGTGINPVKITVKPARTPDIYENNDSISIASKMAVNFIGITATIKTAGATISTETDQDFYQVTLPAGYYYTINGRLHDASSLDNSFVYTADVILSYSLDGVNWASYTDEVLPTGIVVSGGKTIYFKVLPSYENSTGTYMLDLTINQSTTLPVNYIINFTASGLSGTLTQVEVQNLTKGTKVVVPAGYVLNLVTGGVDTPILTTELNTTTTSADNTLRIYPNPTHRQATVSFAAKEAGAAQLTVFAIDGRKVLELNKELPAGNNAFSLSLPKGIYVIHVNGKGYTHTAKLISLADHSVMPEITTTEATPTNTPNPTLQKVEAATSGVITMNYAAGDQLLYKATVGNGIYPLYDIPTASKLVTFDNSGLVAYYPFNGNANDESGNGNNGTVNGATLTTDRFGNAGKAYSFDGVDDYIKVTNGITNVSSYASVSLWFYKQDYWEDTYQKLFCSGSGNSQTQYVGLYISQGPSSEKFYFGINQQTEAIKSTYPSCNVWHNAIGVYDGSVSKLYIDGVETAQISGTCSLQYLIPLYFGWGYRSEYFRGKIDDIRIYNRAITDAEITELYNSEKPVTTTTINSGLVAYYPFNGNANDESGNGNNGTVNGATLTTDRFGNSGKAYSFDGVDDYIKVVDAPKLRMAQFSISLWFLWDNIGTSEIDFFTGKDYGNYEIHTGGLSGINGLRFIPADYPSIWPTSTNAVNTIQTGWNHVVVIYNGNSSKVYMNNAFVAERNSISGAKDLLQDNSDFFIGRRGDGSYSYNGKIDDIRMYDRALTDAEVTQLYNSEKPATDLTSGTVTDIDGNVYRTITLGTQTWMAENLKTTKYRNGEVIAGAWNYNNDASLGAKYGKFYDWYSVDDIRGLAPAGWHVPSDAEWNVLETYVAAHLGYSPSVAKALTATSDWAGDSGTNTIGNDLTKNNSTLFSALPGGYRDYDYFNGLGGSGFWWSASTNAAWDAWGRVLGCSDSSVFRWCYYKELGFSVRCVRDN